MYVGRYMMRVRANARMLIARPIPLSLLRPQRIVNDTGGEATFDAAAKYLPPQVRYCCSTCPSPHLLPCAVITEMRAFPHYASAVAPGGLRDG